MIKPSYLHRSEVLMIHTLIATTFYRSVRSGPGRLRDISSKWSELASLSDFLDRFRIDLVLDVGANEGQFARKLRRLGYRGHIVSFEPDPRAYALLREAHGSDPCWRGFPIGLGELDQRQHFHLAENSVLSSFRAAVNPATIEARVEVPVRRLDALLPELLNGRPSRVLLKTDTQGYDLQVLRGATGCLEQIAGILAELSVIPIYRQVPSFDESLRTYREAGFDLLDLSLVNRTPDGRVLEYDGLFVNREVLGGSNAAS